MNNYSNHVKDYLGSTRKVMKLDLNFINYPWTDQNGTAKMQYSWRDGSAALASEDADYAPYNDRFQERIDRLGWLGKEKDLESGLGDHGVRKYDAGSGRFLSVDPLWEKYLSWTPYQYAGNNPVNAVDVDGRKVIAKDDASRSNIINSVESQYRNKIGFSSNGEVNFNGQLKISPMMKDLKNFSNIGALQFLVNSTETIEVSQSSEIKFSDNGKTHSFNLDDFKGNGATLLKGSSGENPTSLMKHITQVIISPNQFMGLSGPATQSSTTAHELYGHLFLYLWGNKGNNTPSWKGHEGDTRDHIIETEKRSNDLHD